MESINTMEQLEVAHMEIRDVVGIIKSKLESVSNVDDFNIDAKGERELIEQTIGDIDNVSANQVAALRTRLNALVPINRLPAEIFTYIVLFANTDAKESVHPYMPYTWVCHRWRSVLIQNSAFWTVIQHHHSRRLQFKELVYEEILRRSKSAKLDVRLSNASVPYISTLKKLFSEEGDRIFSLWLGIEEDLLQLVLSSKEFPSLQRLAVVRQGYNQNLGQFIRLLPVLVASDHLETLQCSLGDDVPFDQLSSTFSRIRNLCLFIKKPALAPRVCELLHDSPKLQTLQLTSYFDRRFHAGPSREVVLPELQFLSVTCPTVLNLFKAPKLLSLNATWGSDPAALAFESGFLSIRYLYIRGPHNRRKRCSDRGLCVLGAKERILCGSLFSHTHDIFYEDPSTQGYARDCFHLGFTFNETFAMALQGMSLILPQLTNLVELYLLIPHSQDEFETLISHLPSIEKFVIQRGIKLLDAIRFLNKTPPPCPQLKYLYFKTLSVPRNFEKYVIDVGKSLTKCIQSRQGGFANQLEHITLGNCPPLPDIWLEKLQDLGTEVVTEKDGENIRIGGRSRKAQRYESAAFSDVEI